MTPYRSGDLLRVLGRATSINVRKVLWTGVELGLDLRREDVDLADPAFRALNPNAMMPVLVEQSATGEGVADAARGDGGGDFSLWESNAICRYLAERFDGERLWPGETRLRARVSMWMDWQAGELNNSWRYAFSSLVRHSPQHQDDAQLAAGIANWNRHMGMLEGQLQQSGGPYVLGERFTLADVVLGLSAHRWQSTPMARPLLPAVEAWLRSLEERPGFLAHGRQAGP